MADEKEKKEKKDAKPKGDAKPKAEGKKKKGKEGAGASAGPAIGEAEAPNRVPRLKEHFEKAVLPELMKRFSFTNPMQAPRLEKIVVNMAVGDALVNIKFMDQAVAELTTITGQKPSIRRSKKSIANFKLGQKGQSSFPAGRQTHILSSLTVFVNEKGGLPCLPWTGDQYGRKTFQGFIER